ncbi:hypothetical protein, partial [Eikenella halliae]|uniref:hypothetical protein n=1 Tax=Eikenella halliae TaxID=1795832 RepID=UPI001C54D2F1
LVCFKETDRTMSNIVLSSSQQCRCKTPTLIGNLIVKELLNRTGDKQIAPCETAKTRTIRHQNDFVKCLKTKIPLKNTKHLS